MTIRGLFVTLNSDVLCFIGAGRVEHRRYWLTEDLSSIKDLTSQWIGLTSVGMVESQRHIGDK